MLSFNLLERCFKPDWQQNPSPLLNEIYDVKNGEKNTHKIPITSPISNCGQWLCFTPSFSRLCFRDYCSSKEGFIYGHQVGCLRRTSEGRMKERKKNTSNAIVPLLLAKLEVNTERVRCSSYSWNKKLIFQE